MLALENDRLALTVRPDLGGRIDDLIDQRSGKRWLWHSRGYRGASRSLAVCAPFDESWTGRFLRGGPAKLTA